MAKNIQLIFLLIIFGISFIFRIININQLPPSLNWDETSIGYNAYSILNTGKDEWGSTMPLIFRAFGDYKLPVYIYFSTPFIALFGLNSISVKLLSIIIGSLIPIVVFFIAQKIFPKKTYLSVIALLITSFSPWSIFLSRIALEANVFLFLFLLSIYFLFSKKIFLSTLFFGISLFCYNSSRVLLPFYLVLLAFSIHHYNYNLFKNWTKFIFFAICLLVFIFQTFSDSGQARYKWVTLLDQGSINRINETRSTFPIKKYGLDRLAINKVTYFSYLATTNYFTHFQPNFLFISGGNHQQFSIPGFYLLPTYFLPLFYLGLIFLIINIFTKKPNRYILLSFLYIFLISPIPSAITRDSPHVLRSITLLPFSVLLIVYGINQLTLLKLNKYFIFISISILLLISQLNFWPQYRLYSLKYSPSWQYGYLQTTDFIKNNYSQYDQIVFTKRYGEPHEFILFNLNWPPLNYQNNPTKDWNFHADWYWVDGFDKFKFVNDWEIKTYSQNPSQKTLLITSPQNYNNKNAKLLKTIYFKDNSEAFNIVEYDKSN